MGLTQLYASEQTEKRRVLIYHYDDYFGEFLASFMQRHGYDAKYIRINSETRVQNLVEGIQREKSDLVLLSLDFGSPFRNENRGLEDLLPVKVITGVPIIVLDSDSRPDVYLGDSVQAGLRGADALIPLPANPSRILGLVDEIIRLPFTPQNFKN